jgi:hypothetical protein
MCWPARSRVTGNRRGRRAFRTVPKLIRAIRLPDGNLPIPVELVDPEVGFGLAKIGPADPR